MLHSKVMVFFFTIGFFQTSQAQTVSTLTTDTTKAFESIHWHDDGRIYSVDYVNGRVYGVETNGNVTTLVTGISGPVGGGFDTNGNFYFCSVVTNNVYRLNPDTTTTIIASGLNQPISVLTSDHPDTLLITEYENNRVSKLSLSSGQHVNWLVDGGLNGPDGIVYNHQNELMVANFNNPKLFKVVNGTIDLLATLPVNGFMGYCNAIGTEIYVTALDAKQVYKVEETGQVSLLAGTGTSGNLDGPSLLATFRAPNGICSNVAGDSILVADHQSIRVITGFDATSQVGENDSTSGLSLHHDATNELLRVFTEPFKGQKINWKLYDVQGRQVDSNAVIVSAHQKYFEIETHRLEEGTYYLHVFNDKDLVGIEDFVK